MNRDNVIDEGTPTLAQELLRALDEAAKAGAKVEIKYERAGRYETLTAQVVPGAVADEPVKEAM